MSITIPKLNDGTPIDYVDAQDNLRILKKGDTMHGNLKMNNNCIKSLHDPIDPQDAATKNYVDTCIPNAGDTLTGDLNMNSHTIKSLSDPINAQDAATKNYVDTKAVLKVGDTMTGDLTMSGKLINSLNDPIDAQDAATKNYVDTKDVKINAAGGITTDNDGLRILAADGLDVSLGGLKVINRVKTTGDSMTGDLTMNSHAIKSLNDPIDAQDAATKNYVDSQKKLITVWAETKDPSLGYVWSFGAAPVEGNNAYRGYVMMSPGRVLRMSLSAISSDGTLLDETRVMLTVNGFDKPYSVTKPSNSYSSSNTFTTPYELSENDTLNFRTVASATSTAINSTVCIIIEIDI